MLIGDTNDSNRSADLQILVSELASRHISRYPITVESINNQEVRFMDTRIGDRSEVAILNRVVDDNKLYYVLSSHLIKNPQYSPHSPGYNSRRTGDLSKMRKLLSTVVKPLEPMQIINRSFSVAKEVLEEWKGVVQREMRTANGSFIYGGIDRDTVMQDIIAYSSGAAPFRTGVLAQISTPEFVALYTDYRERMNYKPPRTCVFVNPDGVVYLSGMQENTRQGTGPVVIKNSINDIPQELAGHYAMLKLIEPDKVLKDIGLRAGNCSFWLHEPLLLSAE